jgi:hypothetical protein
MCSYTSTVFVYIGPRVRNAHSDDLTDSQKLHARHYIRNEPTSFAEYSQMCSRHRCDAPVMMHKVAPHASVPATLTRLHSV